MSMSPSPRQPLCLSMNRVRPNPFSFICDVAFRSDCNSVSSSMARNTSSLLKFSPARICTHFVARETLQVRLGPQKPFLRYPLFDANPVIVSSGLQASFATRCAFKPKPSLYAHDLLVSSGQAFWRDTRFQRGCYTLSS